ncbi:MAG: KH domain-containing protein, partial [Patescibacteria group bacterium]
MTHRVHPFAHRLGIIRDWKSRGFAMHSKYRNNLKTDTLLREWLEKKLRGMYLADIEMERGAKTLRVIIKTSRPGMIIGRSGEGATKLKNDINDFVNKLNAKSLKQIHIKYKGDSETIKSKAAELQSEIKVEIFKDYQVISQPNPLRKLVQYIDDKDIDDPVARAEQALEQLSGE